MNKIGLAADLHFVRGGARGLRQCEKTFREMIAGMLASELEWVIFAGDVFHQFGWFTPNTFEILASGIKDLQDAGTSVIMIPGNHDYDQSGEYSAVDPFGKLDVTIHKEITGYDFGDYWITFIPWIPKIGLKAKQVNTALDAQDMMFEIHEKIVLPALAADVEERRSCNCLDRIKLCIFHASLIGFSPCATAAGIVGTDFLLDPEKVLEFGFDYMIGGHFHRRHAGKMNAGYVGSMERNDFGEKDNPTGWLEIDGDIVGGNWKFHNLENSQRFNEFEADLSGGEAKIEGSIVKLKPHVSRYEVLNRAELAKPFYDKGAVNVVIEPIYTDVEQVRSKDIRADQTAQEQFDCWAAENPTKATDEIKSLLKFENDNSYPEEIENTYFMEAAKVTGGV